MGIATALSALGLLVYINKALGLGTYVKGKMGILK